jgi:hypothetical protein
LIVLTAACPVLLSVQIMTAAVGVVGDVLEHALKDSAGGVITTRLTTAETAEPVLGVAVKLPL